MLRGLKTAVLSVIREMGYSVRRDSSGRRLLIRERVWGRDYVDDLRQIAKATGFSVDTIVVAGAFEGAGAFSLSRAFPGAAVSAFEPVHKTFQVLTDRARRYPNVVCYQAALGQANAEHLMHVNAAADTSSLLASEEGTDDDHLMHETGLEKVRAITLDHFCQSESIQTIDYLHSDVQGYELNLLKGASRLLRGGGVSPLPVA